MWLIFNEKILKPEELATLLFTIFVFSLAFFFEKVINIKKYIEIYITLIHLYHIVLIFIDNKKIDIENYFKNRKIGNNEEFNLKILEKSTQWREMIRDFSNKHKKELGEQSDEIIQHINMFVDELWDIFDLPSRCRTDDNY